MKEYILCAAIWYNDGLIHQGQPKNIKTGFVIVGRRHHNCYATAKALAGIDENIKLKILNIESKMTKEDYNKHQGFITSLDRYVDRKEAWLIAKNNNQIKFKTTKKVKINFDTDFLDQNDTLISEHLY
jgi:hypothetical protein